MLDHLRRWYCLRHTGSLVAVLAAAFMVSSWAAAHPAVAARQWPSAVIQAQALPQQPLEPLAIRPADGGKVRMFQVEVARTSEARSMGLMFRSELDADHGMLFIFAEGTSPTMWMRNTYVPLDMLFLDAEGVVVDVAADTTPLSDTPIASKTPARAVLELNAGTARLLGIRPGDLVVHADFPVD
ncbi:DUF192 domain-containing protein [Tistrella sp. BH-R2-4]|uniref:DUF192 domain-containing protein n=1 Tax=Tistrella arctica TaxID=3133430 RepID=A0ABU9YSJ9_9PROT